MQTESERTSTTTETAFGEQASLTAIAGGRVNVMHALRLGQRPLLQSAPRGRR
jgi:hypothetical protein